MGRTTSVSLDQGVKTIAKQLIRKHQAGSMTELLRGYILLDLLLMSRGQTIEWKGDISTIPHWTMKDFDLLVEHDPKGTLMIRLKGKLPKAIYSEK